MTTAIFCNSPAYMRPSSCNFVHSAKKPKKEARSGIAPPVCPAGECLLQLGEQVFLDGVDGAFAIKFDVHGLAVLRELLEVVRGGEGAVSGVVVNIVTLVDGGFVLVVGTGGEIAAAHAAFVAVGFDGVNEDVVGVIVVVLAQATAHDAVLGDFAGQEDFNHVIQLQAFLLQGFPQLFSLHHVAGEAVQQPAVLALGLEGFQHHGDGDVVRHEVAAIDIFLGLLAQIGAAADVLAEDGARFDVGQIVLLLDQFALGTLAAAVGAKNQNIHNALLRMQCLLPCAKKYTYAV